MAITNARDIITKSFKQLGIAAEGETLSADAMNDGLDTLNLMLGLWGAKNLMTTANILESYALTASLGTYLMGVTSLALPTDFNTAKPYRIISAFIRNASGNDYPLKLISRKEYDDITTKTIEGIPCSLAYDPGATQQTNQVMTLYLYPVPDAATTYTLFLYSEKPLTRIASLDDTLTMQDIYISAIVPNLAVTLAPEYGRALHPVISELAAETKEAIEIINAANKKTVIDLDLPLNIGSNIMTGD